MTTRSYSRKCVVCGSRVGSEYTYLYPWPDVRIWEGAFAHRGQCTREARRTQVEAGLLTEVDGRPTDSGSRPSVREVMDRAPVTTVPDTSSTVLSLLETLGPLNVGQVAALTGWSWAKAHHHLNRMAGEEQIDKYNIGPGVLFRKWMDAREPANVPGTPSKTDQKAKEKIV